MALSALTWSVWEGALLRMKVEDSVQPLRESMALFLDHVYLPVPHTGGSVTRKKASASSRK
jgi:Tetracyclin repressor-like, C-terminal domain